MEEDYLNRIRAYIENITSRRAYYLTNLQIKEFTKKTDLIYRLDIYQWVKTYEYSIEQNEFGIPASEEVFGKQQDPTGKKYTDYLNSQRYQEVLDFIKPRIEEFALFEEPCTLYDLLRYQMSVETSFRTSGVTPPDVFIGTLPRGDFNFKLLLPEELGPMILMNRGVSSFISYMSYLLVAYIENHEEINLTEINQIFVKIITNYFLNGDIAHPDFDLKRVYQLNPNIAYGQQIIDIAMIAMLSHEYAHLIYGDLIEARLLVNESGLDEGDENYEFLKEYGENTYKELQVDHVAAKMTSIAFGVIFPLKTLVDGLGLSLLAADLSEKLHEAPSVFSSHPPISVRSLNLFTWIKIFHDIDEEETLESDIIKSFNELWELNKEEINRQILTSYKESSNANNQE